jgi:hypothetical protein
MLRQRGKEEVHLFFNFVHEDADARRSKRIQCGVKCSPNVDADSD